MIPVNLEQIRAASMGDDEFMEELIDIYLDDMPRQIQALRDAVENQDAAAAAATAHRLKGASGNVGADSLSALCRDIEMSSRQSRLDQLPKLVEAVSQEGDRVQAFLNSLKKSSQNG